MLLLFVLTLAPLKNIPLIIYVVSCFVRHAILQYIRRILRILGKEKLRTPLVLLKWVKINYSICKTYTHTQITAHLCLIKGVLTKFQNCKVI